MAARELLSIQHHLNRKMFSSAAGRAKSSAIYRAGTGRRQFKHILSAVQNRNPVKRLKTRGLTIVDYRSRPVVSKSRFRAQPQPAIRELKNRAFRRSMEDSGPTAPKPEVIMRPGRSRQTEIPATAKRPVDKIQPQSTVKTAKQMIAESVQRAAAKYKLSPGLINAVIRAESNFQVGAVSRAGAKGLMQLMPATARELGVTDIFDIEQNIDGGAKYLRRMLDRFDGSVKKALAAYNAGPGTVIKYNGQVPYPETRQYVQRVLRFSRQTA